MHTRRISVVGDLQRTSTFGIQLYEMIGEVAQRQLDPNPGNKQADKLTAARNAFTEVVLRASYTCSSLTIPFP